MLALIILLPFLGFIGGCFLGRFLGRGVIFFTTLNVLGSCLLSLVLLYKNFILNSIFVISLNLWLTCNQLEIYWELLGDNLTLFMVFVVTFISTIVHMYSTEYMKEDPHLQRFLAYLSLFTFFMLILITSANFIQMFVGWEGVGVSSYLLINFWFTRIQANKAAIKAMLFNRVADMLMLIGLFSIFIVFETFDYVIIFSIAPIFLHTQLEMGLYSPLSLNFICLFLFLGAMGKSAQLGFHNWLPDAMEGPTPVSALIHAATMVTAGIFLIIRCSHLFELAPVILNMIAIIGALTAFFGATTGLFFHDLKRVIAFSTCSQLGYMMLACGLERFNVAFFHLVTHAFFKALLFLTAGAIIHSMFDEQDTRKFGGCIKYLPITYISFLIGSLNLIGFPYLSGFFSKDLLLELVFICNTNISLFCYLFGLLSIFCTSAYSTRVIILIFFTSINYKRQAITNIVESALAIKVSLVLLSIISVFVGWALLDIFCGLGSTFFGVSIFFNINTFNFSDIEFLPMSIKVLPLLISCCGIYFSYFMYALPNSSLLFLKKNFFFKQFYQFLLKKWYSDRLVNQTFVLTFLNFCQSYTYFKLDRGLLEVFGPTAFFKLFRSTNLSLLCSKLFFF